MKNTYKFVTLAIPALIAMTSLSSNAALLRVRSTFLTNDGSSIQTTALSTVSALDIGPDISKSDPTVGEITYFANVPFPDANDHGTDSATQAHYVGTDMQSMMGDYAGVTSGTTFSFGSLTVGETYRIQFFHHFDQNDTAAMAVHFGDENGASTGDFNFADNQGYISTFEWIADTDLQDFTITATGNGVVNGILLQTVPEPSAALLGGLGALALLRRRRN